ncbi:hypothetical protein ACN1NW_000390 [Acinetobacter baumannii]|nr:hypothetical protein [Acinetobacter baumannii]ELA7030979.1 hypothetical protein [Acinetobacter baumannii]ELA7118742.1 hypothetical protein [Acinetobacter baumannii]ELB0919691.1 hypothetical protein [Acinetobacter baumannii]ELB0965867.1 hypothetical protein [Acinetobacter baumannii]
MKLLNIENITVESDRFVQIKGKKHQLKIMNVGEFTAFTKEAQEIAKSGDRISELNFAIKVVSSALPDVPIEEIEKFQLPQLEAIVAFVTGRDDGEEDAEGGESKPEGK